MGKNIDFLHTLPYPFSLPDENAFIQKSIQHFLQQLQSKRNSINLIGPNEQLEYHVEDCLVALKYFFEHIQSLLQKVPVSSNNKQYGIPCIDLGTGAGFPGILLALCFYACNIATHWYLLEKSPKKCDFLYDSIASLNKVFSIHLPITVVNKNLYDWSISHNNTLDSVFVTARAFRPLNQQLVEAIVSAVGKATVLLYKGKKENIDKEIKSITPNNYFHVCSISPLICSHGKERHLLHCSVNKTNSK